MNKPGCGMSIGNPLGHDPNVLLVVMGVIERLLTSTY